MSKKQTKSPEQLQYIREYTESTYDRLTVRMKKGSKDELIAFMNEKLHQIDELERTVNKTPEQEDLLIKLKSLYCFSKQGTPSVNGLILQLLKLETGIEF